MDVLSKIKALSETVERKGWRGNVPGRGRKIRRISIGVWPVGGLGVVPNQWGPLRVDFITLFLALCGNLDCCCS